MLATQLLDPGMGWHIRVARHAVAGLFTWYLVAMVLMVPVKSMHRANTATLTRILLQVLAGQWHRLHGTYC